MTVKELIAGLQILSNQKAEVRIEAPIQDEFTGDYRWSNDPNVSCYSVPVWGVEDEDDSDGETILLKSCGRNLLAPMDNEVSAPMVSKWLLHYCDGWDDRAAYCIDTLQEIARGNISTRQLARDIFTINTIQNSK